MRRVVSNTEAMHLWAHQAQYDARGSSVFFEGNTIYSYGRHFPMATIQKRGKDTCVLFTTRAYSTTTAKHLSQTRRAVSHMTVFNVLFVDIREKDYPGSAQGSHKGNLADYAARIESATNTFDASRVWSEGKSNRILDLVEEANAYSAFFKLRKKFKARYTPEELDALVAKKDARLAFLNEMREARFAEIIRRDNVRLAPTCCARIHVAHEEKVTRVQRALIEEARNIERWRAGESHGYLSYLVPTMLRIVGDEVQTSRGARFPVAHARLGLALVRRCRTSGEAYKRNGHTLHLGPYAIDSIDAQGNVIAGCHHVSFAEIERIAPALDAMVTA